MHINKLRSARGYAWEKHIIDFANSQKGYVARRLGGSSTGLPDIVITHNESSTIYAMEAKSVTSMIAYIPQDQIIRCLDVLKMFEVYYNRNMWFVFKFGVNRSSYQSITTKEGNKIKLNNKLRMYFHKVTLIGNLENIKFVVCDIHGNLSLMPLTAEDPKPYMETFCYKKFSDLLVENNSMPKKQKKLT